MARPLNVLFLSSEVEPFAKTGGLADVSSSLPKSIKSLQQEIRIMMPKYGCIDERRGQLHEIIRLKDIPISLGTEEILASVKSSFLSNNGGKVQVYFLENDTLFGRTGLYIHPETKKDYADNDARFIFFARAALEIPKTLGWKPDIIHCNDWQTGLVPAYLKTIYKDDPFYKGTKTVLTIHNMAYQGVFQTTAFMKTGFPENVLNEKGITFGGKINMLKAGLVYSDAITTVSERYAEEIQGSGEFGCGLQDIVKKRKNHLTGILNGVDYDTWDPATDKALPHRYDAKTLDRKIENKMALLRNLDLPFQESVPLIGMVSRLASQKGFDLLMEILEDVIQLPVQLVILGVGEERYHKFFEKAQKKYPDSVASRLKFDENLARLIEGGSDMFLMPSRYEPCGLNQIYSLKYGTVPIVRATGGLDDTVEDYDASTGSGTGFKFKDYNSDELLKTIKRATEVYKDHVTWKKIVRNGMSKEFSWKVSGKKYLQLYRSLATS